MIPLLRLATQKKALTDLKQATALSPNDAMFQHNLGSTYLLLGKNDNAEISFQKALALEPYNALYHISYSEMAKDKTFAHILSAIKYSPELLTSPLGNSLKSKADYEKLSDSLISWAKMEESNPIIAARKAKVALFYGDTIYAHSIFERVTNQLPNLNRPWCYSGQLALTLGDTSGFKQNMARSLLLDNTDYLPNLLLANYKYDLQDYNDALYYYKAALSSYSRISSLHSIKTRGYYGLRTIANDVLPNTQLYCIKAEINTVSIVQKLLLCYEKAGKEEEASLCKVYLSDKKNLNHLIKDLQEATK